MTIDDRGGKYERLGLAVERRLVAGGQTKATLPRCTDSSVESRALIIQRRG